MKKYRVSLFEEPGDKLLLIFLCKADDPSHAEEQAEDAYPGCVINTVSEVERDHAAEG